MHYSVIGGKMKCHRNNMHIIAMLTHSPKAVRHTVYGANNIFILVKCFVHCGAVLDLFPKLLRKPIAIRIESVSCFFVFTVPILSLLRYILRIKFLQ